MRTAFLLLDCGTAHTGASFRRMSCDAFLWNKIMDSAANYEDAVPGQARTEMQRGHNAMPMHDNGNIVKSGEYYNRRRMRLNDERQELP